MSNNVFYHIANPGPSGPGPGPGSGTGSRVMSGPVDTLDPVGLGVLVEGQEGVGALVSTPTLTLPQGSGSVHQARAPTPSHTPIPHPDHVMAHDVEEFSKVTTNPTHTHTITHTLTLTLTTTPVDGGWAVCKSFEAYHRCGRVQRTAMGWLRGQRTTCYDGVRLPPPPPLPPIILLPKLITSPL